MIPLAVETGIPSGKFGVSAPVACSSIKIACIVYCFIYFPVFMLDYCTIFKIIHNIDLDLVIEQGSLPDVENYKVTSK